MQRLIDEAHERARTVLVDNRAALDAVAAALMHEESLDREELTAIIDAHRQAGADAMPQARAAPAREQRRAASEAAEQLHPSLAAERAGEGTAPPLPPQAR